MESSKKIEPSKEKKGEHVVVLDKARKLNINNQGLIVDHREAHAPIEMDTLATRDGDTPILYSPQEYIWKAESWVEKLNPEPEVDEDNIYEELLHNRPARLGLGAKFIPHSQFTAVLDPVGKKLQAKLNYAKKGLLNDDTELFSASNNNKRTRSNCRRDPDHDENSDDDSDDDPDSRSGAFKKKQTKFLSASLPTTKKVRRN